MTTSSGSKVESNVANQMSFACCSALESPRNAFGKPTKIFQVMKEEKSEKFFSQIFFAVFHRQTWGGERHENSFYNTLSSNHERQQKLETELVSEDRHIGRHWVCCWLCYEKNVRGKLRLQNVSNPTNRWFGSCELWGVEKWNFSIFYRFRCCWIVDGVIFVSFWADIHEHDDMMLQISNRENRILFFHKYTSKISKPKKKDRTELDDKINLISVFLRRYVNFSSRGNL